MLTTIIRNCGAIAIFASLTGSAFGQSGSRIIHDAEFDILEAQHGTRWAAEDREIEARLEAL
ncbi:MAG: hypothetical protein O7G85_15035, partial [Planctomycetota bacterium]|nr:hypothetical protein [Planctomycetota bacterium]